MLQKKFLCKDIAAAEDAIIQIGKILSDTGHKSALITFYETGMSENEIDSLIGKMKGLGFPELKIAGIAETVVVELLPEGAGILLNFVLTEEADIDVITRLSMLFFTM